MKESVPALKISELPLENFPADQTQLTTIAEIAGGYLVQAKGEVEVFWAELIMAHAFARMTQGAQGAGMCLMSLAGRWKRQSKEILRHPMGTRLMGSYASLLDEMLPWGLENMPEDGAKLEYVRKNAEAFERTPGTDIFHGLLGRARLSRASVALKLFELTGNKIYVSRADRHLQAAKDRNWEEDAYGGEVTKEQKIQTQIIDVLVEEAAVLAEAGNTSSRLGDVRERKSVLNATLVGALLMYQPMFAKETVQKLAIEAWQVS